VLRLASLIRNPFSFLFERSSKEEQVVAYITREHRRGRRLADILEDRYVQNRLTRQQQLRLLERPEVVKALGEQDIDAARETLATR
jgi:hemerythrin-like domain-containing protein